MSEPTTGKKTLIVFSGDLDRAIAAFIIANGAAAMDDQVTMFFTFWGLSILRKPSGKASKRASDQAAVSDQAAAKVPGIGVTPGKRSALQSMFAMMLPKGPGKLGLSKMNFGGLGAVMMKRVMRQQNINTLAELMESAREQGVKLIACTMSMDVMGFRPEDLIDGVEYAGVASYLAEADEANVNLFV